MSDFAIQLVAGSKLETALAEKSLAGEPVELAGVKVRIAGISYHASGSIKCATVNGREVD